MAVQSHFRGREEQDAQDQEQHGSIKAADDDEAAAAGGADHVVEKDGAEQLEPAEPGAEDNGGEEPEPGCREQSDDADLWAEFVDDGGTDQHESAGAGEKNQENQALAPGG